MEKMIKCLFWSTPVDETLANTLLHSDFNSDVLDIVMPKLHTIRQDKKGSWQAGKTVHAVIKNRTAERFQFCPEFEVKSTQSIDIQYRRTSHKTEVVVLIDEVVIGEAIWVNCRLVNSSMTVDQLAINDGFDSTNEFFEYFNEDYSGVIIHWTNLRYG